ncbi:Golgi-associated plant pathogenesis-related protein 1 isoform X1 [Lepeophtheirus salmonis]|uniref:Golgi-associated plant pathogenesis-related protein 1 isoform X1 n=1 Tax=Lepeophtheirus salmonis TaxID=72036 RepID=UPI001AE88470|nr:Golgi-associated plant pathogenesis-related protein 1-like isoform X1 [Lepeophtheirus salmonis]
MLSSTVVKTSRSSKTSYEGDRVKIEETVIKEYADGRIEKETTTKYNDSLKGDGINGSLNRSSPWRRNLVLESPSSNGRNSSSHNSISSTSKNNRQFAKQALDTHNKYRRNHNVPLLELSEELNKYAKEWADHLAKTDSFMHRPDGPYGENLFLAYGTGNTDCDGAEPVDSWYSEGSIYQYGQSSGSSGTGHFTQIVWKGSKKLGMAKSKSISGKTIIVANYDPPGNFIGDYASNVLRPNV